MEEFEKKVSISEPETTTPMEIQADGKQQNGSDINKAVIGLLRRFLAVQQRRALAYASLKRYYFSALFLLYYTKFVCELSHP